MLEKAVRFLPGNANYYLHKALFYLTIPAFAVLLYLYGGNEQHFDRIYIVALCLSCLFCWSDKDTLGALLILLALWLLAKPMLYGPDALLFWIVIYGASLAISIYYFYHIAAKITLLLTLFTVGAETYWWLIDYEPKPKMHYWLGLLASTLWARQLLFNRIIIADYYFNYTSGKTALDTLLGNILYVYFYLVVFVILEYFLRHLAALSDLTLVYDHFSPIATAMSALTLVIIYMHYFYNQSQKHIKI